LKKENKLLPGKEILEYEKQMEDSWVFEEMYQTRNIKGGFKHGLLLGLPHSFLISLTKGKEFWNFRNHKMDSEKTMPLRKGVKKILYGKPDNKITFQLMENLDRSGTMHEHD